MSKRTFKDWFYLEKVSHRAIDDIMQTPKKEVHFFFFSVCCIVFNCSWQLMFDIKAKKLCKTHSFSNWWWFIRPKSFLHSKNCFLFILFCINVCSKPFYQRIKVFAISESDEVELIELSINNDLTVCSKHVLISFMA